MRATGDFHLTIQDVLERHKLGQNSICRHSGYQKSSVSLVCRGERNEAALSCLTVLESLFELTGDCELLLTGRRNVYTVEIENISPSRANIAQLVANAKRNADVLKGLSDIFEDGVVDAKDAAAVKSLSHAIDEAVKTLIETKESIKNAYENNK